MKRKIIVIMGLSFLTAALFLGTPFEFLNSTVDRIASLIIILLITLIFILIYRQVRLIGNKIYKWISLGLLIILSIPYVLAGFWTLLLTISSYHPIWKDISIYTNDKKQKVISQWRETSGSIYDYRDRRIIKDFGQFRISFDCNIKDLKGTWTKYNIDKDTLTIIDFDKKTNTK